LCQVEKIFALTETCRAWAHPIFTAYPSAAFSFPSAQPFLDADHPAQALFPERKWALLLPAVALVGAVTVAAA
jgi:hypothetical protein